MMNGKYINKEAFTIIEAIMVIIIMGVACAGLAAVIYQVLQDTHKPEAISSATALAEEESERVIRLGFGSVVDENRNTPQAYSGDFSNYSWEVRVDSIDTAQPNLVDLLGSDTEMANYKVVEIRVHHSAIGYISIKFLKTNY